MFNNLIPLSMKRIFVLLMVALMSVVIVNAKTVRGYVSDKDGNPVVGMKMVVVNADNPSKKSIAVTDEEGTSPCRSRRTSIHQILSMCLPVTEPGSSDTGKHPRESGS